MFFTNNSISMLIFFAALLMVLFISQNDILLSSSIIYFYNNLNISIGMTRFNLMFILIISFVSSMIFYYCFFYMSEDKEMNTFSNILLIFMYSMLLLVFSESFFSYIMGWDGLGVSSFLLVVFYNTLMATRSGLVTFITNRLGDLLIILSFIVMFQYSFSSSDEMTHALNNDKASSVLFMVLLIMGAFTKSAQIPFSAWLPAAMSAPTPVSALVHSSTLVTAGLFVISSFSSNMDKHKELSLLLMVTCAMLSLLAGCMAMVETDFKKLVAMSTLSQMGIIGYSLFSKEIEISIFHIFSHATFKSLLFLTVGFMMLYNLGYQDIRIKSMNNKMMKTPLALFTLSSFSLMGFMYSSGFFSKDMIILNFSSSGTNAVPYIIMLVSCMLTVCYTLKTFTIMKINMVNMLTMKQTEKNSFMVVSCLMLGMFTLYFGMIFTLECLDAENYTLDMMNKMMGILIILLGFLLMRMSWYPKLYSIMNPTVKNSKLMVYFMQMTNLQWLSNGFFSKMTNKSGYINMDSVWWNFNSEILMKSMMKKYNKNMMTKIKKNYQMHQSSLFFVLLSFSTTLTVMMLMF